MTIFYFLSFLDSALYRLLGYRGYFVVVCLMDNLQEKRLLQCHTKLAYSSLLQDYSMSDNMKIY